MADSAQPWFVKALQVGIKGAGWFEVKAGSEQDKAWNTYFAGLGWTPYVVRNVRQLKERSYTMPVQWPGWLPSEMRNRWW